MTKFAEWLDTFTAEDFAVSYACKTAVGAAIWPLKVAAVQAAAKAAREDIERMAEVMKAANWSLDAVAPAPRFDDYSYRAKNMKRALYFSVFEVEHKYEGSKLVYTAKRSEKQEAKFIADAEESAAYQYNLFVMKLVAKIGAGAVSATLTGDHVWSFSILSVTMEGGRVDRWKTQQITNRSKLGLWFPQWPSRLMKGGK